MRLKRSCLILTFLIFICLVGAVSAADNETQVNDDITVEFNQTVYRDDLGEISVEIPENTSGNLRATINDVEFYNENVNGSVRIPISIPQDAYPLIVPNKITDHTSFGICLFFNNVELKSNHTLKVMSYPKNFTTPGFPSEILKDDSDEHIHLFFPESARGPVEIYIDGELSEKLNATMLTPLNSTKFYTLPIGNHSVRIKYAGDSYYLPFEKNFTFNVVDMTIHIPTNIVLDHDDCITAKILNNTDGTVTVYVDGKQVFADKLDKYGEFLHSMFYNITCGSHLVEVKYVADNFTKSKSAMVNVSYDLDVFSWNGCYGDINELIVIVPVDFNKDLIKIRINNTEYKKFKIDDSGWIELDISSLRPGNYTAYVDLSGDGKYYSTSMAYDFTISPGKIRISNVNALYSQNAKVKVYINDELALNRYVTFKIGKTTFKAKTDYNGVATLKTSSLKVGKFTITASVGDLKSSKTLNVKHFISLNTIKVKKSAKKVTLKAKLAKKLKNKVIKFKFNGKTYKAKTNKNGIAKVTFKVKNLKAGKKITYQATYLKDTVKKTVKVKK